MNSCKVIVRKIFIPGKVAGDYNFLPECVGNNWEKEEEEEEREMTMNTRSLYAIYLLCIMMHKQNSAWYIECNLININRPKYSIEKRERVRVCVNA